MFPMSLRKLEAMRQTPAANRRSVDRLRCYEMYNFAEFMKAFFGISGGYILKQKSEFKKRAKKQ